MLNLNLNRLKCSEVESELIDLHVTCWICV